MAKTYTTEITLRFGEEGALPVFTGQDAYAQALAHRTIHTVQEVEGVQKEYIIPWHSIAMVEVSAEGEDEAATDNFCGGEA